VLTINRWPSSAVREPTLGDPSRILAWIDPKDKGSPMTQGKFWIANGRVTVRWFTFSVIRADVDIWIAWDCARWWGKNNLQIFPTTRDRSDFLKIIGPVTCRGKYLSNQNYSWLRQPGALRISNYVMQAETAILEVWKPLSTPWIPPNTAEHLA
jgi:hypothetical protein